MRGFGKDWSKTMQFKLLKIGGTTQCTQSQYFRDWVHILTQYVSPRPAAGAGRCSLHVKRTGLGRRHSASATRYWVAAGAFLGALLFVNPVFSYHDSGRDSNSESSNGLVCTLGFANGGFGSGAGEEWIQLGTGVTQVRWGDFNGDGKTGDRQVKTLVCSSGCGKGEGLPEILKWDIRTIYWEPIIVCEVIDCSNPAGNGDDDGGNTCEPGTPGCETASAAGTGGPPDSPPGCINLRLTEYGMECQLTCPNYPVTGGGVACLDVIRQPYPRGMVTIPNYYTLNGPWVNQGPGASCSDPDVEFPMVTNSSVRIDFRLRQNTPPAWRFDERPWNILNHGATNEAYGMVVEHTYDTSSFSTFEGDKPYNGPSLTEEMLSAYQVQVFTWWDGFVITRWDQWGWDIEYETREVCDEFGVCSDEEVEVSREYVYRGPQENTEQVDLLTLGYPQSSMFSDLAWDSRQEPVFPYHCRVIPTPIIEVQSILVGFP